MVRYLTTNGKTDTYTRYEPFTLRYRRVNGPFYESINVDAFVKSPVFMSFRVKREILRDQLIEKI